MKEGDGGREKGMCRGGSGVGGGGERRGMNEIRGGGKGREGEWSDGGRSVKRKRKRK